MRCLSVNSVSLNLFEFDVKVSFSRFVVAFDGCEWIYLLHCCNIHIHPH